MKHLRAYNMKNLFIDGGNLLKRSFYSPQNKPLTNSDGKSVGHILCYMKNLLSLQERFEADNIFIAWDIRDTEFINFRQDAVGYKATRDRSDEEDSHRCDKVIWAMCEYLGIRNMRANKLEADDIISWLCSEYPNDDNVIVSNDKDFLQLINYYPSIKIFSPIKQELINESNHKEHTDGVDIDKYLLYKAIIGDKSDNISGLFRYGPVKARKIVENVSEGLSALSDENKAIIKRNMWIMDLRKGLDQYSDEIEFYSDQIVDIDPNLSMFFEVTEKLGLFSIYNNKSVWRDKFGGFKAGDMLQNIMNSINN